jgi:DNA-binding transcriptional ArsR family regulator
MEAEGGRPDAIAVARALGHENRLRVFFEYHRATISPSRVSRRLDMPLNVVAYHTNALRKSGCIEPARVERRRGVVERFYRAAVSPLIEDEDWQRVPLKLRRRLTRSTVSLVVADATRAAVHGGFDGVMAHVSRTPLRLDDAGAQQLTALLRRLLDDIARIERDSAARGGDGSARELIVLCFDDLSPIVPA